MRLIYTSILVLLISNACSLQSKEMELIIYESSANGKKHEKRVEFKNLTSEESIILFPDQTYQQITGFGGSFTESSAYLLNQLSKKNRDQIIEAYFGNSGAMYSLTRTHINSCDFSLGNYSYVKDQDKTLSSFSIQEDKEDIIPMIKDAMKVSAEGFKIIASPWTAPPFMKDNNSWVGGKLLQEHYSTWALYFSKYILAYKNEGIDIWGITVENEPLGNGNNWESMHFEPEEMVDFVKNFLGPKIDSLDQEVKILGYDQNRDELEEWARVMYQNDENAQYFDGTAIHWYASTFKYYPDVLNTVHNLAPDKHLIETEGCVDAQVPVWKDDNWYWSKEATDWGWTWAEEAKKADHPKYVPVHRYARDIIGCLNNWVDGWIDWNMVLDRQGGPNWFQNWCVAPVIVDSDMDEVYFTPLYYTMMHFSKHIRPGAFRIKFENSDDQLMVTAAKNPDGSIVLVVLNMEERQKQFEITLESFKKTLHIDANSLQTILLTARS